MHIILQDIQNQKWTCHCHQIELHESSNCHTIGRLRKRKILYKRDLHVHNCTLLLNMVSYLNNYISNFSAILVVPTLCYLEVEWVPKSVLLHSLPNHNQLDSKVEGTKMLLRSKCKLANGIVLYGVKMPLLSEGGS